MSGVESRGALSPEPLLFRLFLPRQVELGSPALPFARHGGVTFETIAGKHQFELHVAAFVLDFQRDLVALDRPRANGGLLPSVRADGARDLASGLL